MREAPFTNTSAANADAVFVVRGTPGERLSVRSIVFSYSGAPAGGRLRVLGLTSNYSYDVDVTATGMQTFAQVERGIPFADGEDVEVRLFAGGAGVVGKVNAVARWNDSAQWLAS